MPTLARAQLLCPLRPAARGAAAPARWPAAPGAQAGGAAAATATAGAAAGRPAGPRWRAAAAATDRRSAAVAPRWRGAALAAAVGGRAAARRRPRRRVGAARAAAVARGCSAAEAERVDALAGERVTESRFCHGWTLHQLADGYRYCADDVVCSHLAMEARPGARRLLELGSGVGTIGLLWLGQQPRPPPPGSCRLLEAQEVSVALCRRTLRRWGLEDSVDLRHGDLREPETVASLGTGFDLVVTNPPYMQPNVGALPRSSQKRHCRHELRGGLRDFCAAARAALAPGHGRLCLVHTASRDAEVSETLREFGFQILRRVGIFWRGSRKSVAFVAASGAPGGAATGGPGPAEEAVEVQQADGAWSPQYRGICEQLGL